MGSLEISGELQLGVCNHEESCASPHTARKGKHFFLFVCLRGIFYFYNFYWHIVPLQCCVTNSFCLPDYLLSHFSHVRFFATLWTVDHQALLSMGILQAEYWSGLLCPPPGNLLHPGMEPVFLMSPAWAGRLFTTSALEWKSLSHGQLCDSMDYSPPDFSVYGILQARIWE